MLKRIATLSAFALSLSLGASDSQLNLDKAAMIGGSEVKAGTYKVQVNGNKATLRNGKTSVEADVTVENASSKYAKTTACCLDADGKYHLKEVRLGGTATKLLFKDKSASEAGH